MATLDERITALAQAVGADIKALQGAQGGASAGDIILTARTLAAPGWLPADGSAYLQASYAELFAEIGLLTGPWTARTAAEANYWRSVTYGNGLFVAVAYNGTNRVMTSQMSYNASTQFVTPQIAAPANINAYIKA